MPNCNGQSCLHLHIFLHSSYFIIMFSCIPLVCYQLILIYNMKTEKHALCVVGISINIKTSTEPLWDNKVIRIFREFMHKSLMIRLFLLKLDNDQLITIMNKKIFGSQHIDRLQKYSQQTQSSNPFSETNFQDFSSTYPGLRLSFQGLWNSH